MEVDSKLLSNSFEFHLKKAKQDYNKFKSDLKNKTDINLALAMSGIYHAALAESLIKMLSNDIEKIKKVIALNNTMIKDFSIVMDTIFLKIYGGTSIEESYEILGVKRDAPLEKIKKAYREKAAEYHPDRNTSPGSEAMFRKIRAAWEAIQKYEKEASTGSVNENIIRNINQRRMNPKLYNKYPSRRK